MIYLYTSNNLNSIIIKCLKIIKKNPLKNPLEKEYFLIENENMEEWINIFIAEREQISANIEFKNMYNFIWKIFKKNFNFRFQKDEFEQDSLTWKLMNISSIEKFISNFGKIDTQIKKIHFCTFMADLFSKYLLHQNKLIINWEKNILLDKKNSSEKWQKKLWNEITKNNRLHFLNLTNLLFKKIRSKKFKHTFFSNRIFIIGIHHLYENYLKILNQISPYLDIHIFIISPYKIKNISFSKKNIVFNTYINREFKKNILYNSLFSLTKYAYKKLFLFKKIPIKKYTSLAKKIENPKKKLLFYIQNEIFFLKNEIFSYKKLKQEISKKDFSLSIHCCHNIRREVENLQNNLLKILNENKKIFPQDILVLVSNIDNYSATIRSVFNKKGEKNFLPFTILNQTSKENRTILYLLEKLFKLHDFKFCNIDVLELLQFKFISRKFNFSKKELEILKVWIKNTNIRWGLNNNHLNKLGLNLTDKNTWENGIKKLLLGYAMNDYDKLWRNISPFKITEKKEINVLEKLIQFMTTLNKWKKIISKPKKFKDWLPIFKKMIVYFFLKEDLILKKKYIIYENIWKKNIYFAINQNYKKKVFINIFVKKFLISVKNFFKKKYYSTKKINFLSLYNFNIIPFKVIYILGLNKHIYPRIKPNKYFDLSEEKKYKNHENLIEKDSYTFLEILASSKKYFILSYINYCPNNNLKSAPSILIEKLLNYIKNNFFIKEKSKKQEILKHIHLFHSTNSFDTENFSKTNKYQSFDADWFKILSNKNKNEFNFFKKMNLYFEKKIELKKLILFWKNPVRFFFQNRLEIVFPTENENLTKNEPFALNSLEIYSLNEKILNGLIKKKSIKKILKDFQFSGRLPYNFNYFYIYKEKYEELLILSKKILENKKKLEDKKIYFCLSKNTIYGTLNNVQETGILKWKSTLLNYNDMISLWLEHLIYCISGGKGTSVLYGIKNKKYLFLTIEKNIAISYLEYFIQGYLKGLNSPILLTKSGFSWMKRIYNTTQKTMFLDKKNIKQAKKNFLQTWYGNMIISGEKDDLYIKKIIPEITEELIQKMCKVCEKWIVPILNQINY
ncbi:exodeoxyribonuclease V subunit gamma [Buchnera aphidicola]|uniref:exodeoxyribonuclease V subunit gamma n=1 Tax=Buchnera aphidicola TaxID=9 RepID=UPI0031B87210